VRSRKFGLTGMMAVVLILLGGIGVSGTPMPAQAVAGGSYRICNTTAAAVRVATTRVTGVGRLLDGSSFNSTEGWTVLAPGACMDAVPVSVCEWSGTLRLNCRTGAVYYAEPMSEPSARALGYWGGSGQMCIQPWRSFRVLAGEGVIYPGDSACKAVGGVKAPAAVEDITRTNFTVTLGDQGRTGQLSPAAPAKAWPVGPCPATFDRVRGVEGFVCACPAGTRTGEVFGTDVYRSDSAVCRAAEHAGALAPAAGGNVTYSPADTLASPPSTRNGVTSRDAGRVYGFRFTGASASGASRLPTGATAYPACPSRGADLGEALDGAICTCTPEATQTGSVYGNARAYSTSSSVCRAALHGGVIGPSGGVVGINTFWPIKYFPGSQANGVSTSSDEPFTGGRGFSFNLARAGAPDCPTTGESLRGAPPQLCYCTTQSIAAGVGVYFGGEPGVGYADTSYVCRAAKHGQAVGFAKGGLVLVTPGPARSAFKGWRIGNLTSEASGPVAGSMTIEPVSRPYDPGTK
jgi:hypothetical protein